MTNYNLPEFKTWLEADPTRKENLPSWDEYLSTWQENPQYWGRFYRAVEGNPLEGHFTSSSHQPYVKIAQRWLAQERERERVIW